MKTHPVYCRLGNFLCAAKSAQSNVNLECSMQALPQQCILLYNEETSILNISVSIVAFREGLDAGSSRLGAGWTIKPLASCSKALTTVHLSPLAIGQKECNCLEHDCCTEMHLLPDLLSLVFASPLLPLSATGQAIFLAQKMSRQGQ